MASDGKYLSRSTTPQHAANTDSRSLSGGDPDSGLERPPSTFLDGTPLRMLMAGITVVMLLSMLDISIISTAIPQITSDFHRLEDVGWYVGSYQLASSAVQPLTGKLYMSFPLKWTFLFFVLIFEVGSVVCGAVSSSTVFIIGRAVAGLGSAGLVNGSLTICSAVVEPKTRPLYLGIAMGIAQIGIIMGPLLGGAFTEHATWRWCFYINLPLGGLAALVLLPTRVPEQTPKSPVSFDRFHKLLPHLDLQGFLLFSPAAIMLLIALQFGSGEYGWKSPKVIGLFCGAGVTAILFLFWEHRKGKDAMIPFSIVGKRVVWASGFSYALLMAVTISGGNFMPIYLQSVKGLTPTMSGVYMLSNMLPQVFFIVISGALVTKLGYYIPWAIFAPAVTGIACGLISTWTPASSLCVVLGYQVLYGARGAGTQMGVIAIQYALSPAEMALGNSFIAFSMNLAAAILATISNTVFQESLASAIEKHAPSVDPKSAIAAGGSADAVRALVPSGSLALEGVLLAFADSFGNVIYLLAGLSVVSVAFAFGMGFVDVRRKREPERGET